MTRGKLTGFVLCIGVVVGIAMGPAGAADNKAMGQINGKVHLIQKDKSTLVVMKGSSERQVIYKQRHQMDLWHPGKQQAQLARRSKGELVHQL